ncbi:alpha/beta fold hydrolase [Virgibacillus litoralis]|uniref:Alpha/beta hydrolase family protein n=1 Tax=Virgibacillus litoralis TaxID=578221 RepID=A0ABS4HC75_9BACI|nr:alpha/beta fold hydrolase [Virgibacillus litoralis]MBP1948510.1 putative alpha/beta hydrolase family protein [Virgibacillus litoralis]
MNKKHIISVVSLFAILISIILVIYIPKETKSEQNIGNPTVFVHGYKGTFNSFGNMLNRFEYRYGWGNKVLVYRVSPQGRINVANLSKGKTEPAFVQVIFENSRASFMDTSSWLSSVLSHMKETYQIGTVNLVGHSMGGLVALKFIEEYQDQKLYPRVAKLVTVGSPFDGVYSKQYFQVHRDAAAADLKPDSVALQTIRKKKHTIPGGLNVLNIGSTGDLVAMPESVQSLRSIVRKDQLQVKMIEDDMLGHSEMHEDTRVDKLIHSFLQSKGATQ